MRTAAFVFACVLLTSGCGKKPQPTTDHAAGPPPAGSRNSEKGFAGAAPKGATPIAEKKLTLAETRALVVDKMTRAQVKEMFGKPSYTQETTRGGLPVDDWAYTESKIVWDPAAEKFFRIIHITFERGEDAPALSLDAR